MSPPPPAQPIRKKSGRESLSPIFSEASGGRASVHRLLLCSQVAESSPVLYVTRMAGAGSDGGKRKENSLSLALFFPITTCAPLGRGLVSNELGTSLA